MATIATSATAAWVARTSSTSFGLMFSPERMMMSFFRPVIDEIAPVHAAPEVAHAEVAVVVEGAVVVLGMHVPDELLRPADEDLALLAVGDVRAARRDRRS